MAFIECIHVPDRSLLGTQGGDHLFRFTHWHARIVLPLNNEQRNLDRLHVIQRTDLLQERAHGGVPFVTIFNASQVAAIFFGVFKKGHKIADSYDVNGRAESVTVVDTGSQHHVSAIASPINGHP